MNWRHWFTGWWSQTVEPEDREATQALAEETLGLEEQQKRLLREQLDHASETLRHLEIQWRLRGQGTTRDHR